MVHTSVASLTELTQSMYAFSYFIARTRRARKAHRLRAARRRTGVEDVVGVLLGGDVFAHGGAGAVRGADVLAHGANRGSQVPRIWRRVELRGTGILHALSQNLSDAVHGGESANFSGAPRGNPRTREAS